MTLRVFVTRELFPFTAGGIGRVVANILMTSSAEEAADTAVLFVGAAVDRHAFTAIYPGVRFLAIDERDYRPVDESAALYPPKHAFSSSWLLWESSLVLQGLRRLEQAEGPLGYIEFADWGAPGFAAIQEKRLGRGFADATLAVRLHTTDSVLAAYEQRTTDVHGLALYDMERKALADCDRVVAQLAPVSAAMREFYGFDEAEWAAKTIVHAPPVLLDALPVAGRTVEFQSDTPLVFSSKLQDIKRPDVFVLGCVQFMRANPGYTGEARFLAHSFDVAYQSRIVALIPPSLAHRFVFVRGLAGLPRERAIAGAVCVFPSPWESFCLAAYEASMSGALCVLNGANPAFGDATPWRDGENCMKFDGSAAGLASALSDAYRGRGAAALVPVRVPDDAAPWHAPVTNAAAGHEPGAVTAVVAHRDDGTGLLATLDAIAASSRVPAAVVVVDDGSSDPLSLAVLERLEASGDAVEIVRLEGHAGRGATWNAGLARVSTGLVALVPSGSLITADFLDIAVRGLARSPEFDLVTGQQAYAGSLEEVARGDADPEHYWILHGDAHASGHVQNRYAADAFVMRTARARSGAFAARLAERACWEFLLRHSSAGMRTLVSPNVHVVSPAHGAARASTGHVGWTAPVAYGDLMTGKHLVHGGLKLPAYAFAPAPGVVAAAEGDETGYRQRYIELRSSETVRAALFVAETLQRHVPWLLALLRRAMGRAVLLRRR